MTSSPNTLPSEAPNLQDDEIDLRDLLAAILRRWKILVLTLCIVFAGVALYTFLMKPVYEASSLLHVQDNKSTAGLLNELSFNTTNPVNAEIEILQSRTNAEQVVKQLHLNWQVSKKTDDLTFKILEFTSDAKKPVYKIQLTGDDTFDVYFNGDLVGRGKSGALLRKEGFRLLLTDLRGKEGDNFKLTLAPFENVVANLQAGIKASQKGKLTSIIRVSYASTNPVLARDIVNTLVQAYLAQSISFKSEEADRAVSFVEEQLKDMRNDLDKAEKNLQDFKSDAGVVKLDSEAEELIRKLSDLEKRRAEVVLQQKQMQFALDALKNAAKTGDAYTPVSVNSDPVLSEMATRLNELEVQKRALQTEYTQSHPVVKNIQGQVEALQIKMQSSYETSLANLIKQEQTVSQQLKNYESHMRNLPEAERDLARLTRHTKVSADIYTFLLQKHEEARIARASTISNINIVDPAIVPFRPIKPKVPMNLLLGLVIGLALGVGLVFGVEYLDDTIKNADEAKRVMGLPLLAVIPHIFSLEQDDDIDKNANIHDPLIAHNEQKSVAAEAFRALRTSVHFSAINREKKIILLTSSFPGEGKSVISANLAAIFSQTGVKVLIVDCDLRRSTLHEKFGLCKTPGLSELLTGDIPLPEAIQKTAVPNLDMIAAGTTPPNPAELLGSDAMHNFLLSEREKYDHIIVDAPPVLAVTDATLLTAVADIVILVMEAGRVPIKVAQHMKETLSNINAPVAGFVINDKTGKGERYGYYGGRYYRYGKNKSYGYAYGDYPDKKPAPKPNLKRANKITTGQKPPFWKKFLERLKK
ncbi:MAG: polysaccharide biosynthesis tyrosine autokinase [Mangrovibacterium sp.]|nr:polysaccharide biosynthesis tyrosine autokinase [Mangrovibacterium sp.]